MNLTEALAVIEQAFEQALAPDSGRAKRRRPGDPKRAKTRAQRPKERGHIKTGDNEQEIEVPGTVQEWHAYVRSDVLDLPDDEAQPILEKAGTDLAATGQDLGLDTFGRLEVKERDKTSRKAKEGVVNRRNAALVVYAKGWRACKGCRSSIGLISMNSESHATRG